MHVGPWGGMMRVFPVRYRVLVAIVVASITPALVLSFVATAQELAAQYDFNVPAGEAGAALQALALQSKSQIAFSPDQVASVRTPALIGRFTVNDALNRLLGRSKLSYRVTDTGSIVVYDKSQHSQNMPARSAPPSSDVATSGSQLEEVVVTAQKRRENLQIVPVAVTALDSQALENARVENVMDLGGLAPNVYVMQGASVAGSNATPFMTIRGIQSNVTGTVQTDSGIAIYVDGLYLGRASGQVFDLADVKQMEVLRGPQGTLFGRNSVGGAINITTQEPAGEFGVRQDVSVGNFGEFRTKSRVDLDEFEGFRLSISYLHSQTDGYMKNLSAGHFVNPSGVTFGSVGPQFSQRNLGSADTDAFLATLTYRPPALDDLILKYKFDYAGEDSVNNGVQILAVGPSASAFYPPPYGLSKTNRIAGPAVISLAPTEDVANTQAIGNYFMSWGQSLAAEYDPSDALQIKNITAYRGLESTISVSWTEAITSSPKMGPTSSPFSACSRRASTS